MRLPRAPYIRSALGLTAVAAVLFLIALVRAIRIDPVQASDGAGANTGQRITTSPPAPPIDAEAVGQNDIFQPERTAMGSRYRMPGESGPVDATPAPAAPKPVVLGTVMSTDGSHFATCQLPGGKPTVVRVGDKLGEYTVTSIERNKVVFRTAAGALLEIVPNRPGT